MFKFELPIYVNTRFNYFCENCGMSELRIETNLINANDEPFIKTYMLTCEHYQTCKTLMHNLRYNLKVSISHDDQIETDDEQIEMSPSEY